MTQNSDAPAGPTTVEGLRAVADWLEQHPDETVNFAFVRLQAEGREDLVRIGAAFGGEATEELDFTNEVRIERKFGQTTVYAGVPVAKVRDAPPPVPEYEPILAGRS